MFNYCIDVIVGGLGHFWIDVALKYDVFVGCQMQVVGIYRVVFNSNLLIVTTCLYWSYYFVWINS